MAKNNQIFLIGGLGLAAFLLYKNAKGSKRGEVVVSDSEIVQPGSEAWANQPDAVIDAEKQKLTLPAAMDMAKEILAQAKDAFVIVKHKGGKVGLRSGRKKIPANKMKGRKIKTLRYKGKKLSARRVNKITSLQNRAALTFI